MTTSDPQPQPRLTTRALVFSLFEQATELNRQLPRTFLTLLREPRKVYDAYLYGDRTAYSSPVRYTLFSASLFVFAFFLLEFIPGPLQALLRTPIPLPFLEGFEPTVNQLIKYSMGIMLLLLPIGAAISYACFAPDEHRYNFAEFFVVSLYLGAQILICVTLLAVPLLVTARDETATLRALQWMNYGQAIISIYLLRKSFNFTLRQLGRHYLRNIIIRLPIIYFFIRALWSVTEYIMIMRAERRYTEPDLFAQVVLALLLLVAANGLILGTLRRERTLEHYATYGAGVCLLVLLDWVF